MCRFMTKKAHNLKHQRKIWVVDLYLQTNMQEKKITMLRPKMHFHTQMCVHKHANTTRCIKTHRQEEGNAYEIWYENIEMKDCRKLLNRKTLLQSG